MMCFFTVFRKGLRKVFFYDLFQTPAGIVFQDSAT